MLLRLLFFSFFFFHRVSSRFLFFSCLYLFMSCLCCCISAFAILINFFYVSVCLLACFCCCYCCKCHEEAKKKRREDTWKTQFEMYHLAIFVLAVFPYTDNLFIALSQFALLFSVCYAQDCSFFFFITSPVRCFFIPFHC